MTREENPAKPSPGIATLATLSRKREREGAGMGVGEVCAAMQFAVSRYWISKFRIMKQAEK
jgi:hypothetical protein